MLFNSITLARVFETQEQAKAYTICIIDAQDELISQSVVQLTSIVEQALQIACLIHAGVPIS